MVRVPGTAMRVRRISVRESLRRLGRIVGLDDMEVIDEVEIDGHPRILAVLSAAG